MTQWITDLEKLFAATLATVATIRTANSLPTATVHIGAQYLEFNEAAPRIVIVPTGTRYEGAVRLRLDVNQLPKPFHVNALASREWQLASDWRRFPFTP